MSLVEKLNQEDVLLLNKYLNYYSDGGYIPMEKMEYFLRFWNSNKKYFYKMFGENFILKKEILFEKSIEELMEEMDSAIRWGNDLIKFFCLTYKEKITSIFEEKTEEYYSLRNFIENTEFLVKNEYSGNPILIPGKYTKSGRSLQINSGCKIVKMIGKIADAIGIDVKERICSNCGRICTDENECPVCKGEIKEMTGYEAFRRAHSLVLNQKKIKGKLCLSIHPLDFLTMSDNDCGWTSCMSWTEDFGDYRLGTIEMMNSPCVIISYVEAKDDMWICDSKKWNNKRWRQLYLVTPELILGNRQYPFDSDDLQGAAIKWIKNLAATVGYGPYTDEACQICNNSWNTINGNMSVHFHLYSEYMYNDIYDTRLAYTAPTRLHNEDYYELCFSGPAVCCQCGDIIDYPSVEASQVLCKACDKHWKCDSCGEWHSDYEEHYSVGDYIYCDWCYHNELKQCEVCGDRYTNYDLNSVYIQIINTQNKEIIEKFNYNYVIDICDNCIDDYIDEYGKIYDVKDMWGLPKKAFDINNISDEALQKGCLNESTIKFLKSMRDADSDEVRLNLINKFYF